MPHDTSDIRTIDGGRARGAFTLVELLVVVAIIVIALLAVLPAFSAIVASNNYTAAITSTRAALARASASGVDGGVAFLFDPREQRMVLQPLELWDRDATLVPSVGNTDRVPAYAYRPTPGAAPIALPPGTGVYGLSFSTDDAPVGPRTADQLWYFGERDVTSAGAGPRGTRNWLFPRNDILHWIDDFNPNDYGSTNHPLAVAPVNQPSPGRPVNAFRLAQTFFVPFSASGETLGSGSVPFRDAYIEFPELPFDPAIGAVPPTPALRESATAFDPEKYDDGGGGVLTPVFNPEVRLRPVDQIAVVDLPRLASDTGLRDPWYVRSEPSGATGIGINNPGDKLRWQNSDSSRRVSEWIDANAEIIGFTRFTGLPVRAKEARR